MNGLVGTGLAQLRQGGQPRHGGDGVAVERAGLRDEVARAVLLWIEGTHQLLRGADRRQRKATAHDLADTRDVRRHAVVLLGPAVRQAKARDHLVEDEQDPVPSRDLAQALQEAGLGRDEPLERLDDDRGQLIGVGGDDALHRGQIVVRRDQHVGLDRMRDA